MYIAPVIKLRDTNEIIHILLLITIPPYPYKFFFTKHIISFYMYIKIVKYIYYFIKLYFNLNLSIGVFYFKLVGFIYKKRIFNKKILL